MSGKGVLEIYNLSGQKLKTIYQGTIQSGVDQKVEFNVPETDRTNLIYVLRVGKERVTGKLIQAD